MSKQQNFKIIKEGLAMARFDLVAEDMPLVAGGKAFSFDVEEPEPENDELYVKLFRCLSATTTQSRFFDFSTAGVLKTAVPMFEGKTIFANHNMDVTRWKGVTKSAAWDDKNEPNGVNALFVLDRTADPNLVRGVETGALRSASATLWFSYKRSHPELKYFYDHLGEEVDGEVVRFVVTGISNVGEMSIVWEGEDQHAKSFNAGLDPEDNFEGEKPMEFSKNFLTQLSLSGEPEAGDVEAAISKKIAGLETVIATLKPEAETGKKHLAGTREKAAALYKAAKGEDVKESFITNVIEKADLETAQSFVEEYQGAVEESVPLSCPKCGEKLTRRSSASANDEGGRTVDVRNYKIK